MLCATAGVLYIGTNGNHDRNRKQRRRIERKRNVLSEKIIGKEILKIALSL
jgi:hypothetical protein